MYVSLPFRKTALAAATCCLLSTALRAEMPVPPVASGAAVPSAPCEAMMPLSSEPLLLLMALRLLPEGTSLDTSVLRTRDGRYWAAAEDLLALHLRLPGADADARLQFSGRSWVSLDALPGMRLSAEPCTETLLLSPPPAARRVQTLGGEDLSNGAPPGTGPGAYLNYDAQAQFGRGNVTGLGNASLHVFGSAGSGELQWISNGERGVRLESRFTHDRPASRQRLTLGDAVSTSDSLGAPLRFAGIKFGTDFSLQPQYVPFALPQASGVAALPSTLDIYVNQVLRERREVDTGPFVLRDLPVVSGSGDVSVVVRDATGRSQTLVTPFFTSPQLLREGLKDYSLQAGVLRQNFGLRSFDYGSGFAAGGLRRGFSEGFTAGLYAEGGEGQGRVAVNADGRLSRFGVWNLALTQSQAGSASGGGVQAGLELRNLRWSFSAQSRRVTGGYRELGESGFRARDRDFARIGYSGGLISLSIFGLRETSGPSSRNRFDAAAVADPRNGINAGNTSTRVAGFGYSQRLGERAYFNVNASFSRSTDGAGQRVADRSVGAALILNYGRLNGIASSDFGRNGDTSRNRNRVSVQNSDGSPLGTDWQVGAEDGNPARLDARLRKGTVYTTVINEAEVTQQGVAVRSGLQGASAWMPGMLPKATRLIESGYADVDAGAPNVRVYMDNQLAGVTGRDGHAVLPDLRAYEPRQIRLDEEDLPLDSSTSTLETRLTTGYQSGVRVRFQVPRGKATRSTAVRLRTTRGTPPAGTALLLDGQGVALPLGYDGLAVFEAPAGSHVLEAFWADGRCKATVQTAVERNTMPEVLCELAP